MVIGRSSMDMYLTLNIAAKETLFMKQFLFFISSQFCNECIFYHLSQGCFLIIAGYRYGNQLNSRHDIFKNTGDHHKSANHRYYAMLQVSLHIDTHWLIPKHDRIQSEHFKCTMHAHDTIEYS